mmetsp:Transcript_25720/g.56893  ORF Transcript_25720/g.56893 Transcript_25720/m.56893 type:complete len:226 (+) Transcript_25720:731-1408(+)
MPHSAAIAERDGRSPRGERGGDGGDERYAEQTAEHLLSRLRIRQPGRSAVQGEHEVVQAEGAGGEDVTHCQREHGSLGADLAHVGFDAQRQRHLHLHLCYTGRDGRRPVSTDVHEQSDVNLALVLLRPVARQLLLRNGETHSGHHRQRSVAELSSQTQNRVQHDQNPPAGDLVKAERVVWPRSRPNAKCFLVECLPQHIARFVKDGDSKLDSIDVAFHVHGEFFV